MSNTLAIILGLLLVGAATVDVMLYGTDHMVFLGQKMLELIEWLAVWR